MITLKNVEKNYTTTSIGPFTLTFPKTGITSIIGPNGAGKSTMLLMIGRLLQKDRGTVIIDDLNIDDKKMDDFAKKIATLQQENHFVSRLTVRQLASFGRFPYSQGHLNAQDEEIISKYIDFLNLTHLENRYLDELSGGERQRAYIAMILCQESDYILLDEPLNNLDIAASVQMLNYLKEIATTFKKSIIMVMHDINFAAKYSDYLCALKNGKIVAYGTTNTIMNAVQLSEIFNTKIDIIDGPYGVIAVY